VVKTLLLCASDIEF